MRCRCCNDKLEAFDDFVLCKTCIRLSKDQRTSYVDPQHKLITDTNKGCVITGAKGVKD